MPASGSGSMAFVPLCLNRNHSTDHPAKQSADVVEHKRVAFAGMLQRVAQRGFARVRCQQLVESLVRLLGFLDCRWNGIVVHLLAARPPGGQMSNMIGEELDIATLRCD